MTRCNATMWMVIILMVAAGPVFAQADAAPAEAVPAAADDDAPAAGEAVPMDAAEPTMYAESAPSRSSALLGLLPCCGLLVVFGGMVTAIIILFVQIAGVKRELRELQQQNPPRAPMDQPS